MVKKIRKILMNMLIISLGAAIAACALECFLVPNNIIDGGIIGISIMVDYLIKEVNLGTVILALNLPFIFMALQKFGKLFVFNTLWGVLNLSLFVSIFHKYTITSESILASIFGGVILGLGVGLILRNNGSLDGTEIVAIRLAQKFGFSIGEIIMTFNIFIGL